MSFTLKKLSNTTYSCQNSALFSKLRVCQNISRHCLSFAKIHPMPFPLFIISYVDSAFMSGFKFSGSFLRTLLFLMKILNIVHLSQFSKAALSVFSEIILCSCVISIKFNMSKVTVEWKHYNRILKKCINILQKFFEFPTLWCVCLGALTCACTGFCYVGDVSQQELTPRETSLFICSSIRV